MGQMLLVFDWDGKTVHKKTRGFKGKSCVKETDFIEKALGIAKKREYTNEFHEETEVRKNKQQR
jgi:hypothetical protein